MPRTQCIAHHRRVYAVWPHACVRMSFDGRLPHHAKHRLRGMRGSVSIHGCKRSSKNLYALIRRVDTRVHARAKVGVENVVLRTGDFWQDFPPSRAPSHITVSPESTDGVRTNGCSALACAVSARSAFPLLSIHPMENRGCPRDGGKALTCRAAPSEPERCGEKRSASCGRFSSGQ
jgi:hypothetical protein